MIIVHILRFVIVFGTIVFFCGSVGLIIFSMTNIRCIKFTKITMLLSFPMFLFFVSSLLISQSRYIEYSYFDRIVTLNVVDGDIKARAKDLYGSNMPFSKYESVQFEFVDEKATIKKITFYLSTDLLTQYEININNNKKPNEKYTTVIDVDNRKLMNEVVINFDINIETYDCLVLEFKEIREYNYIDNSTFFNISFLKFTCL